MARKPGVKPKPTALLKLQGTYEPSRHDKRGAEPKPTGELKQAEPPDDMTESQRRIWGELLANVPPGMLADLDYQLFGNFVRLVDTRDRLVTAQNQLDQGKTIPFMVRGRGGYPIISPIFKELMRTIDRMTRLAAELGFTPSSRTRISVDPGAGKEAPGPTGWGILKQFPVIQGGIKS